MRKNPFTTITLAIVILVSLDRRTYPAESSTTDPPALSEKLSPARRPAGASEGRFDPVGKSFFELVLEAKHAFERRNYSEVKWLMDYALTLEITSQQKAMLLLDRGIALSRLNDKDAAVRDFDAALRILPRLGPAYMNRGSALVSKNRIGDAMKDFDEAIKLNPRNWEVYELRGWALERQHRWSEALENHAKAIALNPRASRAYARRAGIEVRYRRLKEALVDADKASSIDRENVAAQTARINVHILLKQYAEAEQDLKTMPNLDPRDPATKDNSTAWLRATCLDPRMRNGKEAVAMATRACEESSWKSPGYIDTLAAACAEAGDFDSAMKYQQEVLRLTAVNPAPNENEFRARLELYQQHQPYRDELKP